MLARRLQYRAGIGPALVQRLVYIFVFICITVCSSIVNFSYLLFEFTLMLTVDLNKEHSADLNYGRPVPTRLSP